MPLSDRIKKLLRKGQGGVAKRTLRISWLKLISGLTLIGIGILFGSYYMKDTAVMLFGVVAILATGGGGYLSYASLSGAESGYQFAKKGKKKFTGRENAFIWFARHDPETKRDIPVMLKVCEINHPPRGARLHYFRKFKKHYYELFNNTETKKLEPFTLPDKIPFPPNLFKIPAAMQTYKDAIEYSPPTLMQKLAPGMILIGMCIVGLLMIMTV